MKFENVISNDPILVILDRHNKCPAVLSHPPAPIVIADGKDLPLFRKATGMTAADFPATRLHRSDLLRRMDKEGMTHVMLYGHDGNGKPASELIEVE